MEGINYAHKIAECMKNGDDVYSVVFFFLNEKCTPVASCFYTLGLQMITMFGKAMEALGGGALLKEVWCSPRPYFLLFP